MLKFLSAVDRAAEGILRWTVIVLMVAMTFAVFLQVVFRYALDAPLGWSEEFARFVFVWLTFMGAASLTRLGQHIRVDAFHLMMPSTARVVVTILGDLGALLCVFFFLIGGIGITRSEWIQLAPAMQIEMGWIYLAIPVAAALMTVWIVADMVRTILTAVRGGDR